jgi:pyrophosphate--fructose-6-phosphate 1-phosphotransferase
MEERKGKMKPVIRKALVDLQGKAYLHFAKMRQAWRLEDSYQSPGPMQFFGDEDLTDSIPRIL